MARSPLFRSLRRAFGQALLTPNQLSTERPLSRRDFLSGALLGAAVLSVPRALALPLGPATHSERPAIVGAGLAGLVAAYRLGQAGYACDIYEASARVGGRVHTKKNFNAEAMFSEMGGEFIDSGHTDLIALATELGLVVEDLALGESTLVPEIYFVDGKPRTEAEVIAAFRPFAEKIAPAIAAISPNGTLTIPTYREPLGAKPWDLLSLRAFLDGMRNSVDGWLLDLLNVAFTGEYGLETEEQSALNLLVLIDPTVDNGFHVFGSSDESKRIRGGNGQLAEALVKALPAETKIHFGHRLVGMRDDGQNLALYHATAGGTQRTTASRTILALPFTILREVDGLGALNLSPVKLRAIREFGYGTNAKVILGFRSRFWHRSGAVIPASAGKIYSDLASQELWDTSRQQKGASGILTSFLGGHRGAQPAQDVHETTLCDLQHLYPGAANEWDGNHLRIVWRQSPYVRGSYVCPKPGQYTTLMGSAAEPELNGRLLFAGEHCSVDYQGYMNGAVQSGNAVAASFSPALPHSKARGAGFFR